MNSSAPLLARLVFAKLVFGTAFGHDRQRKRLAYKWLSGKGLEIEALNKRLAIPPGTEIEVGNG
jgi:hypothetical protein